MEEKKNIEVVSGDGSNLEISPVYDHLNVSTPKSAEKKPKYVVIPEEKKKKKNTKIKKRKKTRFFLFFIFGKSDNKNYSSAYKVNFNYKAYRR